MQDLLVLTSNSPGAEQKWTTLQSLSTVLQKHMPMGLIKQILVYVKEIHFMKHHLFTQLI